MLDKKQDKKRIDKVSPLVQVDPSIDLTVLEAEETLGGTWCAARIFPGLLANHAVGAYEYADKRMPSEGLAQYGYISAETIHAYLTAYAREWGVYDRIRFRTAVAGVHRHEDGRRWVVHLAPHSPSSSSPAAEQKEDNAAAALSDVILDDGTPLRTDWLIYATGYHTAPTNFSRADAMHLGLPVPASHSYPHSHTHSHTHTLIPASAEEEEEKWLRLDADADAAVCRLTKELRVRVCVLVEIQTTEMAIKHTRVLRKSHPEPRGHEVRNPRYKEG